MYVAARRLIVMGRQYDAGEEIPVGAVPPRTLRNLLTLRRMLEVDKGVNPTPAQVDRFTGASQAKQRGRPKGSRNKPKVAAPVAAEA